MLTGGGPALLPELSGSLHQLALDQLLVGFEQEPHHPCGEVSRLLPCCGRCCLLPALQRLWNSPLHLLPFLCGSGRPLRANKIGAKHEISLSMFLKIKSVCLLHCNSVSYSSGKLILHIVNKLTYTKDDLAKLSGPKFLRGLDNLSEKTTLVFQDTC